MVESNTPPSDDEKETAKIVNGTEASWGLGMPNRAISQMNTRQYIKVPRRLVHQGYPEGAVCWRVELHNLGPDLPLMGFDIIGDTILGRGALADIDLDEYSVFFSGVSRRHLLLRPTRQQIYAIDLGSTNGTMINHVPLPTDQARPLQSGDILTIGRFSIRIQIVQQLIMGQGHFANQAELEAAYAAIEPDDEQGSTTQIAYPLQDQTDAQDNSFEPEQTE
jgi:hypothetical protein